MMIIIVIISLTSIFSKINQGYGRLLEPASQQHKVDNQPLVTLAISRVVITTLSFRENPIQSPSGSCLSTRMLEQVVLN